MYVACAAEYYYYTTTLVKEFTDKNVDLKKWTWPNLGGVVRSVRPPWLRAWLTPWQSTLLKIFRLVTVRVQL